MNDQQTKFKELLNQNTAIKIDLGCGTTKKAGYIGIDLLPLDGVDFIADFEKGLDFIPNSSVDEMISSHLLEHIDSFENLMAEIHRVLKSSGTKKILVPHFSNPYYYSDYTHRRFFGLYTFDYFSNGDTNMKRKVPSFYNTLKFKIISRKLIFRAQPFYIRNKFMSIFTFIFNLSPYMQELYEGMFSSIIPCYEIQFVIQPIK